MNLMGWNKETLYTDYAVLGTWPCYISLKRHLKHLSYSTNPVHRLAM